jgi:hypothetical protein
MAAIGGGGGLNTLHVINMTSYIIRNDERRSVVCDRRNIGNSILVRFSYTVDSKTGIFTLHKEVIVALDCGEGKDPQSGFNIEVFSFHLTVPADFVTASMVSRTASDSRRAHSRSARNKCSFC